MGCDFAVSCVDTDTNPIALAMAPFTMFLEFDGDGNADRLRGRLVIRDHRIHIPEFCRAKWLMQQDGRIDPDIPFDQNPRLKLFRDGDNEYPYFREEFTLSGWIRTFVSQHNPSQTGRYQVSDRVEYVDSSQEPPANPHAWDFLGG